MTTRQKDIRKSNFVETSSSQSTDYFDLVRNGQNLKITQANLVSSFGTSGSLQAVGEATAIPVLNIISTVNYIRNLLGGSGISTSLSPQGGIQIDHNFNVDKGGTPIMINETADQPTLVSLKAGTGISVGASGNSIQIALSATPPSTKTVIVYEESDLGTLVGDLRTLEPDTYYQLVNDISMSNRLKFSEDTILAGSDYITTLTYTGVGNFLNLVDVDCKITDIAISAPNGTLFNISSTTGLHFVSVFRSNFSCLNVGTVNNILAFIFNSNQFTSVTGTGMVFTGAFLFCIINTLGYTMPGGSYNAISLGTATFLYFLLSQALFNVSSSGYVVSGLASSGNISVGGSGGILNSVNFGTTTFSDNISPYDNRWEFQLNPNLPNSLDVLMATHSGATITIAGISTPVKVGSTWVSVESHRFTFNSNGTFTYTGKGGILEINVSISGYKSGAAANVYGFYIYKNGIQIPGSVVTRSFTDSIGNIGMIWALDLDTNDYIEVWVENQTAANAFILSAASLRIKT